MSRVRQTNQQTKGSQLPGDKSASAFYGNMKIKPSSKTKKNGSKRKDKGNPHNSGSY